ncbi:MAG: copper resistance system multicopper oxidase [Hyphomonas sp.]|uniref:copper resistance system multicopper oxidase n=1 Tax=Hyphomonas sp. TaxID=87 RepID=UPI001812DED3|nr:copper resistance system multicopper oxidase [Hyphomonas sp.]MBA3070184.1 copper resistance system multicopper oxidase [Hyphomonas sp.]MBU3922155.1 copper resistance system multicopper oxidase [Alphaproteobacteria bacterium]MBU4060240.1 copper resistance system multicopper oxidase [Alphaproteobacteria bacterium]MBU4162908.1 copper resistance system multicopper oxidase [Alphaproteobacteria bacterium]
MFTRRHLLRTAAAGSVMTASAALLPAWARSANAGNTGIFESRGTAFDLTIGHSAVNIAGHTGHAITLNGTLPGPLIRFREGEKVTLKVNNTLDEDTSIHWHGLLVPFHMDGVPGISFPGIKPKSSFTYEFAVPQSGTYWYHSHSGLQEQQGHYGPLIIDPADADPVQADREYVLVLSDWSFEHPHKVYARLKKDAAVYNFQQRTVGDFVRDARDNGLGPTLSDRASWGAMRMSPTDISDVTAAAYTYLINGHATEDNWTAIFNSGERIRLRIINASAMTIFNFRIPGLPMTVVAADGLHVQPVETDEFQIGVAETYDVLVTPTRARAFALVAESMERSGQVVATLAPETGLVATAPLLREPPVLTHRDMGMDMSSMDHGSMAGMDHGSMAGMDHGSMTISDPVAQTHDHRMGVGVDNVAMVRVSRIDEPGLGLESVPHRALSYSQLRSLVSNPDTRAPGREMEIHLTGNMERYMWSFDGVKLSEITSPIIFHEGERLRVTLVNDTMMTHPIHLHGMFFDLVVDNTDHKPRKHTVIVKPAERLSFDVTADHVGDWAFHCHLLFHMHAGMMQVVSVLPRGASDIADTGHTADAPAPAQPSEERAQPYVQVDKQHEGHRR